jgi:hypothetical protein
MKLQTRIAARLGLLALLALAIGFTPAFAQGTQTGVITGVVSSTDGSLLPGVAVTVSSPALQGERTATTDPSGAYVFRGLPPGDYKLSFALSGFGSVERTVALRLGALNVDVPTTMGVAAVEETLEVVGESASILSQPQVSTNYQYEEVVDKLAMNRTLAAIAEMAPGITDNGPNIGQVTIGGAFAYDNVFLLNGVDINDNLFGTAHNLYIEDALQEISILTSGISAEYGRFSGGVINAITKSGGNEFAGSFRTDITNPSWQDESLVEKNAIAAGRGEPHIDTTNFIYSATLGGPVVKDRLWFFGAARRENSSIARALSVFGTGYTFGTENRRYEGKLTGSIDANHRVQANYIRNSTNQINNASINTTLSIDERTLVTRQLPNDLFVARYDGVLSPSLFAEAQYSRKTFGFRNTGGTSTDVFDSPFRALGRAGIPTDSHYNAPYFSSFDPEDRNNHQYAAALSYFLSTANAGRHDLKVGGEYFTSYRTGGNSQSATGLVFFADPVIVGGLPVSDAAGFIMPNFQPGLSRIVNFRSVQGAQIDLNTLSLYLNDRWQLSSRWTFNLGVRMERHSTEASQAGITSLESTAIVPRLGATFDVAGDGRWILQASYGHYAGKAAETQFADNTNVGNPSSVTYQYAGPAGQGVGFAPGFDLANYTIIGGSFPVANVFIEDDLNTPTTREWTLQAGTRLGSRGEAKVVYSNRTTRNFLDDFITRDLGTTTVTDAGVNFGTFDNTLIRNTDDVHRREYQGLLLIANYRLGDGWNFGANWTVQLRNHANFEGEGANTPGSYSIIGDRPEFYTEARHYPFGRTDDYQKHKARLYTTYDLGLGAAGTVTLGGLYRYDSPQTYSLFASNVPITAQQRALNPGYVRPPTTQTLFFGERGIAEFESSHLFDFSLHYDVPVYKRARPFIKAELRNAFNKQPLIGFNTTVSVDPNSPVDALGLPTGFTRGANFGTPLNSHTATSPHVPYPRELLFSVGFRF